VSPVQFRKLSPVLIVEAVEPSLPFWTERLGFAKVVEVPQGDRLGFVILARDGVEVMYQSRDSIRNDIPALADTPPGATLYIEVSDIVAVERAIEGVEVVVPRRQTFYGADEIGVREPGGNVVLFAQPA
jgi:uncharacterized glyoxalase superfamily protein PhnB